MMWSVGIVVSDWFNGFSKISWPCH